tara:strand:+ start:1990 stop:2436 length:447 start_codon:yes stop_codon:yes gene_type:complete
MYEPNTHPDRITIDLDIITDFVKKAHAGQTRRDGITPYFDHVMSVFARVANAGLSEAHQAVALIHDTLEDTNTTSDDLRRLGVPEDIIESVIAISHYDNEPNVVYWARVKDNKMAREVKHHDIMDNLQDNPTPRQQEKYAKALAFFAA